MRPTTVSPPIWAAKLWPMPAADNCRAIASVSVPLRAINASLPGLQKLGAIEPSRPRPGTYMPSVFGPISQQPAARARVATANAS